MDDRLVDYVPELAEGAYADVNVRQRLTMTSGVRWNEDYEDAESDVAQMYMQPCADDEAHILTYMKTLPAAHAPGEHWNYSTGETDLLGILVQRATGRTLADYLSETIWKPYGMAADGAWLADECDDSNIGGSGLSATLADYARLGQFVLDGARRPPRHPAAGRPRPGRRLSVVGGRRRRLSSDGHFWPADLHRPGPKTGHCPDGRLAPGHQRRADGRPRRLHRGRPARGGRRLKPGRLYGAIFCLSSCCSRGGRLGSERSSHGSTLRLVPPSDSGTTASIRCGPGISSARSNALQNAPAVVTRSPGTPMPRARWVKSSSAPVSSSCERALGPPAVSVPTRSSSMLSTE